MSRRGNPWLRAGLLHPLVLVGPLVGLFILIAHLPGSDRNDVSWGYLVIPVAALLSFAMTLSMAARRGLKGPELAGVVVFGFVASAAAFVLGEVGWFQAAEFACHGRYECPF